MIDYVEKMGDRPFSVCPFSVEDSLVLSQFTYICFENISDFLPPLTPKKIFLAGDVELAVRPTNNRRGNRKLLKAMAEARRFSDMRIENISSVFDTHRGCQFFAATYIMDGAVFVGFRGTDLSMVGWREDFNMASCVTVPSQEMAAEYLETAAEKIDGDFFVGGHSKGGNLAIYSVFHSKKSVCRRVLRVFSHDGPGFHPEVIDTPRYKCLKNKIIKIVPKNTYVGLLLGSSEAMRAVDSSAKQYLQHDPFTWQFKDNRLKYIKSYSKSSKYFIKDLNEWLESYPIESRGAVVDALWFLFTAEYSGEYFPLSARDKIAMKEIGFPAWKRLSPEDKKELVKILIRLPSSIFHTYFDR